MQTKMIITFDVPKYNQGIINALAEKIYNYLQNKLMPCEIEVVQIEEDKETKQVYS